MSSRDDSLPTIASSSSGLDSASVWFWQFLKTELAPYPGRAWTVGRMTIAATLVMVLVMTFRIPYGFLGAVYTFFLSRENPTATLRAGLRTIVVYAVATVFTMVGVVTMLDDPLTHFLWITIGFFLAFYVIRVVPDYFTAVGFGFTLAAAIPLWDENLLSVHARTENTLWIGFSVAVGSAVTVAVEYVFRRVHPVSDVIQGIESRLQSVESLLRQIASGEPTFQFQKDITLYSDLGTSRLRRLILRSQASPEFIAQMNASIALLGRVVDLASSLQIVRAARFLVAPPADRERCLRLANEVSGLRQDLQRHRLPHEIAIPSETEKSELPFLLEMERTVALIPQAFSGAGSIDELFLPPPLEVEVRQKLLVADAFTNPEYLKFAIRGTLATMLAYATYTAIAWPQLSTSIATCIITALSTIGSSRQKQMLRLSGAIIGGFGFGMGAQVFILPHLDGIVGFTVLFAVVTGISAWIATATPKLSYLGVQMALSFYLINLQEFTIQSSLGVARDRVVGVLLGLLCMWLIFDRLWVRNALQEMQSAFARALQLLSELAEQSRQTSREEVARKVIQLRDQITGAFNDVKAQSDAVVFEFGPSRERKLSVRDDFMRWQPTLRIVVQVQITFLQYIFENRLPEVPSIASARTAFEDNLAAVTRALSDEVSGKGPRVAPSILESANRLRDEIRAHYLALAVPVPHAFDDVITLTQNLAMIVVPLYADVHATFSSPHNAVMHHPKIILGAG